MQEVEGRIIKVEYSKTFKKPTPPRSPTYSNETRHKLFVSNLAWKARAKNLKEFFADFSPVSKRIVFSASGSSAGYGFVSFATKEEAESAVSTLNGKVNRCLIFMSYDMLNNGSLLFCAGLAWEAYYIEV